MEFDQIIAIFDKCTSSLNFHPRVSVQQYFQEMAEFTSPDIRMDDETYGAVVQNFETKIAELLGKESAVFMPSGTMAQQIALRIWSDKIQDKHVAFHPTAHLELYEQNAFKELHYLESILIGDKQQLMKLDQIKAAYESTPFATLLLELPQRMIGGQLPPWDELQEIAKWVKSKGIKLHLDGARLWECKPYYEKEYAEICSIFDSVYVSFYKILGGIAGAILAGPTEFIKEARLWQWRHGGKVKTLFPYVLSADYNIQIRLGKMQEYFLKAQELSVILQEFDNVVLIPEMPQTNMFQLHIKGTEVEIHEKIIKIAEDAKLFLFYGLNPSFMEGYVWTEIVVGDHAMRLDIANLKDQLTKLLSQNK